MDDFGIKAVIVECVKVSSSQFNPYPANTKCFCAHN